MNGDVPNDKSGRVAIDRLSHKDSGVSDTELNNLPEYSILDRVKMNPKFHFQDGENGRFQRMQSSAFIPQSFTGYLPFIMQGHASLQNQLSQYSILDGLKLNPELHLQDSEHERFQREQSSTFIPASQLPAIMQGHVSLQNQDRSFLYHVPRNPHLWTDQPREFKSPEAIVHTVPIYANQLCQQCFQQPSCYLKLQDHATRLALPHFFTPLPPTNKSSLHQTTPCNQLGQPNPEEVKNTESTQQSVETFKKLKTALDSGMGSDLPKARQHGSIGEETDDKMSDGDSCDSDEEINVVDVDDEKDGLSQAEILAMSGICKSTRNKHAVPTSNHDTSHDAPFSNDMVTSARGLQLPNQDEGLMYRIQQNSQLQTDQTAFNLQKDVMTFESVEDTVPAHPHMLNPQWIQRLSCHQQLQPHVTPLFIPFPLLHFSISNDAPLPLTTAPSQKPSLQMTCVLQRTEPNAEQVKEEMHDLAKRLRTRRIELGYTQKEVSNELNNLSKKQNMYGDLTKWCIRDLENEKTSVCRMLTLKPLLELWLERRRKGQYCGRRARRSPVHQLNRLESIVCSF